MSATDNSAKPAGAKSADQEELLKQGLRQVGLSQKELNIILVAVISGMFLATLDTSIMNVALPAIVGDLGGLERITWVVTSYLVTLTIVTPIYGKLSDIYGRKLTYQVAAIIFIVFSGLAGFSTELWHLVVFRAFQGIGAGGLIALPMVIMGDLIPPSVRGRYMGYLSSSVVLSSLAGPLAGGIITDQISWRLIFFINVPVGIVSMVAVHRKFNIEAPRTAHSIDGFGMWLLVLALGPGLIGLSLGGNELAWGDPIFIGLMVVSLVLLAQFVLWETYPSEPILPLRMFNNKVVAVSLSNVFMLGLALFAAGLFVPIYLQVVKGSSATESGLLTLTMSIGMTFAAFLSGRLITRWQRYKGFIILGMFSLTLALLLLSTLTRNSPVLLVTFYMSILGFGLGCSLPPYSVVIQNAVPHKDIGVASTTLNFVRSVGTSIGAAGFGALFSSQLSSGLRRRFPEIAETEGFGNLTGRPEEIGSIEDLAVRNGVIDAFVEAVKLVFIVGAIAGVVALIISFFLKEIPLRTSLQDNDELEGLDLELRGSSNGAVPVRGNGAGWVQGSGARPVPGNGAGPVEGSRARPVQGTVGGASPVPGNGAGPVEGSRARSVQGAVGGASPVPDNGAGLVGRNQSGAGPVRSAEANPIQKTSGAELAPGELRPS